MLFNVNKPTNPWNPNADVEIVGPPTDSVSQLSFCPTAPLIIASSWDKKVRCWQFAQDGSSAFKAEITRDGPVLCADFSDDGTKVFCAGCDNKAVMWDLQSNKNMPVAQHDQPIPFCSWLPSKNLLMTGSWDGSIRYWDGRQPQPVLSVPVGHPFAAGDVRGNLAVVAAGGNILIYNIDQPQNPYRLDSPLKWQPRCIKAFPDQKGYALASIEGRVSIQYIDKMDQQRNFTFKCHREANNVYAVNGLGFHPSGTFATAGSDGTFNFWDKDFKTRLKPFTKGSMPITTCAFNRDGSLFAYAVGYDWSKGISGVATAQQPHIMLHDVKEAEIKSKKNSK